MSENKMEMVAPDDDHASMLHEVLHVLSKYEGKGMQVQDQIALLSNIIGKQVVHLDPNHFDSDIVIELVLVNIENGNKQMREYLDRKPVN